MENRKLTKYQRKMIYAEMLKKIKAIPNRDFTEYCDAFFLASVPDKYYINFCFILDAVSDFRLTLSQLPELQAECPAQKFGFGYWFHPYDRVRERILEKIISSMHVSVFDWLLKL